jgi:hypothetical protein
MQALTVFDYKNFTAIVWYAAAHWVSAPTTEK